MTDQIIADAVSKLDDFIETKKWIMNNPLKLFNKNWSTYIKMMMYLHPQSYGSKIQKRIVHELGLNSVNSRNDKGDFIDKFGDHYELKVSLSIDDDPKINLVQIRPWQNTNYYFISFVYKNKNIYAYCFKLSHKEMENEIKLTKMSPAHGTKTSLKDNKNIEYRLTFPIDPNNEIFLRWFKNYRSGLFDNHEDIISPKNLKDIPL